MFQLHLFGIRAFAAGSIANLMAALARGGLMFILIIWLQGIWLPRHGFTYSQTPLWAGIYMLPMTAALLIVGPVAGRLADRYGARPLATAGLLVTAMSFALLEMLSVNFAYLAFGAVLFLAGIGMGMFGAPNMMGIMNSLPADKRGAGAGMAMTFMSSAQVLSIGVFFTLMILGLAASLPGTLYHGLVIHGVSSGAATTVSHLPPVGSLFAAFLGYNPMKELLGPQLALIPSHTAAYLTGRSFFPALISAPFKEGLRAAFDFAIVACLLGAVASFLRGGDNYRHGQEAARTDDDVEPALLESAALVEAVD